MARFLLFNLLIISNFSLAKIASFDLCADQWLLSFAEPGQVAFLTPLSQDPSVSYFHSKAKNYRIQSPNIETLLSENVTVVLATNYINKSVQHLLEKQGIKVIVIPPIKNLNQLLFWANRIKKITLSKSEIILKLQSVKEDTPPTETALYIGIGGSSPGTETLVDQAINLAGFRNINTSKGWRYMGIESIITQNPDYIFTTGVGTKNYAFVNHPAYDKLTKSTIMPIAQNHTVCACPQSFVDFIKVLKNAKK